MSSQLPSNWISQHAPAPKKGQDQALDLACGKGRNSFYLANQGWSVTGLDRDLSQSDTNANPNINWIEADLETGEWPLGKLQFDLIVVVNYLHRPLFPYLRETVRPGGILIYETFMVGNEAYGRPRSPNFLLHPGELKAQFSGWKVIAHQEGLVTDPATGAAKACRQSIVTRKPSA
ncbi:MAG: class I SAM-dependent methyltransferase [Rhodospirillales bacterium]|nr:class I SAM-dependent methyltransferase [Rhodospirillales bacterium]